MPTDAVFLVPFWTFSGLLLSLTCIHRRPQSRSLQPSLVSIYGRGASIGYNRPPHMRPPPPPPRVNCHHRRAADTEKLSWCRGNSVMGFGSPLPLHIPRPHQINMGSSGPSCSCAVTSAAGGGGGARRPRLPRSGAPSSRVKELNFIAPKGGAPRGPDSCDCSRGCKKKAPICHRSHFLRDM